MIIDITSTDLLIAPPSMPDPRFRNCVIMLTHETEDHHVGLVINRPAQTRITEIVEPHLVDFHGRDFDVYWGGPVSPTTVWMLHDSAWRTEHTIDIAEGWAMTSNLEMFYALSQGDHPQWFRLFVGMCSWASGQLEREIRGEHPWSPKNSWLIAENPGPEWIMDQDPEQLWTGAMTLSSHQAVNNWL
jgi:putative transcriptional regulator